LVVFFFGVIFGVVVFVLFANLFVARRAVSTFTFRAKNLPRGSLT